ncbi:hypothetical protein K458DRAFT_206302 [Lentithecium fluviatile CBS 122367]|uniref:Uncharacterized protein n=1 Tax=Lentithecium fluviatile CBS 122367 TaxID=1168545 RepID=A0A6G1IC79_9PLEO|nr:hypothetical protein K458DRAFT_206302 [Lentithecium fluviatile CBS 122367]
MTPASLSKSLMPFFRALFPVLLILNVPCLNLVIASSLSVHQSHALLDSTCAQSSLR